VTARIQGGSIGSARRPAPPTMLPDGWRYPRRSMN